MNTRYDVIVVGGGHAGTEAALAAGRMGSRVALVSFSEEKIGQMSCNPAIGGLGKGQLVKEIDALFGEMGLAIDDTGIQFRTLNSSKGPAVRSSRAQADRILYRDRIRRAVRNCSRIEVVQAGVTSLTREANSVDGVLLDSGDTLKAPSVVLTTGTFLRGLIHVGEQQSEGGRVGEKAAHGLNQSLEELGLRLGRMKTGTPPRLRRDSIDYSKTEEQPGEVPVKPFSFRTAAITRPQVSCWITATNEATHELIRKNVERSPIFNGQIESCGPRYCPSIEDKVYRFSDKNSHTIFLEPEGFESNIVYPNGISTSLPKDVQEEFLRSIPALKDAEILQYGYAVEYDYVDPTQLERSLAVRSTPGLFLAGQINGTTGYEEAGAQGLIAGINAALYSRQAEPFTIGRDEGYIGVLLDDLTTLGVIEPYRMFTSRAEYRLHLREDNADSRLTPRAREVGLVPDEEWREFDRRQERISSEKKRLEKTFAKPSDNDWIAELGSAQLEDGIALGVLLRRPEINYQAIAARFPAPSPLLESEARRVEIELKFAGYLKRQEEDIARLKAMENVDIPGDFAYQKIQGLSIEVVQRLSEVQPNTLGQASRVSGVTPAALSLLAIHLKRDAAHR